MKKFLLLSISLLFIWASIPAQQGEQMLKLSSDKVEALFLSQNLQLIAEKMNIDIADAEIIQAKLWDNPEISIGSVNLWSTQNQKEDAEINSFPKNTQFSIELSQLIQTANKRGKLIRREKVTKEIAIQDFEETLRAMKVELRGSVNEIIYLQAYLKILADEESSLRQLIDSYSKQVTQGNIAKTELLRLQSSLLELKSEINETKIDFNQQQKTLKALLNVAPDVVVVIESTSGNPVNPVHLSLINLLDTAISSRSDVKRQKLETKYYEKALSYEKAQRVPDITLSAAYDRRGGIWKDFIGFGISFEIPFLNRNQGGIKAAQLGKKQSQYMEQYQQNLVQHEVAEAYKNYFESYKFHQELSNNDLLNELDSMLDIYTKNLMKRNISMLEYLDFIEAYKSNKQTVLTSVKNLNSSFEELQFAVGVNLDK